MGHDGTPATAVELGHDAEELVDPMDAGVASENRSAAVLRE
jgi:hypothetical protein